MTIVVNGRFLRRQATGVGRVGRSWLEALRELGLVDLEVIAPAGVADRLVDRRLPGFAGRLGDAAWEQIVLPIAAHGNPLLSLANTAPVLQRRAAVTVHDLMPLAQWSWFHARMQAYARVALVAARRATRVIAVSHHVASDLMRRGVRSDHIHVVHPAVDPEFRASDAATVDACLARYGIREPYIVVVGVFDPRKHAALVVRAHARLLARYPHQLVLVGAPHPNLAPVALPRWPSLVYTGHVPDEDLTALLGGACVLAFPSLDEGFGLPPLEAMACGTPAVVSDIEPLRESTAGRATLVPPSDIEAWTEALEAALQGGLPPPERPTRTPRDAAQELSAVLKDLA